MSWGRNLRHLYIAIPLDDCAVVITNVRSEYTTSKLLTQKRLSDMTRWGPLKKRVSSGEFMGTPAMACDRIQRPKIGCRGSGGVEKTLESRIHKAMRLAQE
jgi:hypothetical protein